MIRLRFTGHIRSSMASEEMEVDRERISVDDLFDYLLTKRPSGQAHGFSKYNTLVVVNDEEAFSASAAGGRMVRDGDSLLLVPFSHGG